MSRPRRSADHGVGGDRHREHAAGDDEGDERADAPLTSNQKSGAASAAVTTPHSPALRSSVWWSRRPLAITAVPISVPTGTAAASSPRKPSRQADAIGVGHDERLVHRAERARDGDDRQRPAHHAVAEEVGGAVAAASRATERWAAAGRGGRRAAQPEEEDGRHEEAQRVDGQRRLGLRRRTSSTPPRA